VLEVLQQYGGGVGRPGDEKEGWGGREGVSVL